jgi:hypothetical protein
MAFNRVLRKRTRQQMRWRHQAARMAIPELTVGITGPAVVQSVVDPSHAPDLLCWLVLRASSQLSHILITGENDDDDSEGMSDWEEDNGEEGNGEDDAMSDDGDSSSVSGVSSEEVRAHRAHTLCCPAAHSPAATQSAGTCYCNAGLQVQPLPLVRGCS